MSLRLSVRLLGGACSLLAALATMPAWAEVNDLSSAQLQAADVPAGLGHGQVKIYTHFTRSLTVTIPGAHGKVTGSTGCETPPSVQRNPWTQAMIVEYFGQGFYSLGQCGYRFKSASDAHLAYLTITKLPANTFSSPHVKRLAMPHIGDESLGLSLSSGFYAMVFRHQNAVMMLDYVGPPTYSAARFVRLGVLTDSRLH